MIRLPKPSSYPGGNVLLAFDPGPHTGVAVCIDGTVRNVYTIHSASLAEQYRLVYDTLMWGFSGQFTHPILHDPVVVVEDYRSQMTMTREGYYTLNLIGFIVGVTLTAGFTPHLQLPAARRPFLTLATDSVKRLYTHHTPHERDAVAHALAYLAHSANGGTR